MITNQSPLSLRAAAHCSSVFHQILSCVADQCAAERALKRAKALKMNYSSRRYLPHNKLQHLPVSQRAEPQASHDTHAPSRLPLSSHSHAHAHCTIYCASHAGTHSTAAAPTAARAAGSESIPTWLRRKDCNYHGELLRFCIPVLPLWPRKKRLLARGAAPGGHGCLAWCGTGSRPWRWERGESRQGHQPNRPPSRFS